MIDTSGRIQIKAVRVIGANKPLAEVIVLENEDPPEEIQASLHYQHFSRSEIGRYGFFPVAAR